MPTRTPWSVIAVAMAALIALVAPAQLHTASRMGMSSSGWNLVSGAPAPAVNTAGVAAPVDSGVVLINTDISYQGAVGAGTGVVLSPDGVVLTNNHVVEGATQISVTSIANGASYPAAVIGYDRKHDIAVLQLQGASGLPTAPLGNASQVGVGAPVVAIGNANGQGLSRAQGTVTALDQTIVAADELAAPEQLNGMIQVSANVIPGDSGGPLVNSDGQVIGIDTAASGNYRLSYRSGAEGFAIPIDTALSLASQIQSGTPSGSVHIGNTALLGVGVGNAQRQGGVPVGEVLRGSPAAQVGITSGDMITGFAGTPVSSDTALTDLLDQQHPGDNIAVTWVDRVGRQNTADVTLATGPVG